jgi:hypothetical protein
MAIEAPSSKYRRNNFVIAIAICVGLAIWFTYDGYYSEDFKTKHTKDDGTADGTLAFNRKSPPYLIGAAILLGGYLFIIRNNKVIADEKELVINDKEKIPYDSIEKIDKTNFDSKGYFTITYKDKGGGAANRRISDRKYDNLGAILEHLVAEIT